MLGLPQIQSERGVSSLSLSDDNVPLTGENLGAQNGIDHNLLHVERPHGCPSHVLHMDESSSLDDM